MKKKITNSIMLITIVSLFVLFMAYLAYNEADLGLPSVDLEKVAEDHPEHEKLVSDIVEAQKALDANPSEIERYAILGMAWKSLGEQMQGGIFFSKSRETYAKAVEVTDWSNSLFILNAADMSEIIGEYEEAERYYKNLIEKIPSEVDGYRRLASLYRLRLNKSPEEILAIYDKALNTLVFTGVILHERAGYLKSIGRDEEALKDYKEVAALNPKAGLEGVIAELEEKIKQQ
jgi:tetratricopeptide (TPR) repeat protein